MNKNKMKQIVEEEIKDFRMNLIEGEFDQFEKKAEILKGIFDFAKAVEKFESTMTIEMMNAFQTVIDPLKVLLADVGKNPDSFLDKIKKGRRSVVLRKAEGENVVMENDKKKTLKKHVFYNSLDDAFKNKTQKNK